MSRIIDIHVPDIGDFKDVPIVEMPVGVGDLVQVDDTLLVLESDKATLDVPATEAGRIVELLVSDGSRVSAGTLVARLEIAESAGATPPAAEQAAPAAAPAPVAAPAPSAAPAPTAITPADASVHASPSIRRYARTLGVALAKVAGTGPKGRILREDVEGFVKAQLTAPPAPAASPVAGLPDWPTEDFAKHGPVDRQPLSRIVRISGPALARNAMVIPHVCNFDKADVTELEAFRKEINAEARPDAAKITLLAFTVKAVVAALQAYPKFNSSLDGDALVLKRYWNIGVAADTPEGLVVPVIKAADQKGIAEIAAEMADLAAQARAGKLSPAAMSGASFTISSLGGIGGTGFTPIINAPQVAILGMTRAEIQPVWREDSVQPRLIQPLSLSWDHRVVDGVAAARFLQHVCRILSDFRRVSI
ncbi:2-oxo acid dehydrogenase subunit E2 [Pararhodobacter aggregans]|uniref:Dihydrolipoamide acetyltransferase component of pyruvate dehydrogenase complex n=1 Tax=Pararhodobacter aggregans TaxID=404875 RepID=A0A2T7UQB0_9RHOB|nr:2-oxo acid dehydrogenase subunit E2 [Pararhodobacter aggregans]PTX01512.1 pyruvate dehydrogenase E2 component (dihydrolipoamide acetyltransferase) [Pararhodobacter aggregans]PVE46781.1 branched-chain alpha-keto acid dehydrogenase subunit E2 [Pararhodobacter aggregans]